jgi:hypothetical protein
MQIDPYSTHQALLVAAMLKTQGPILEMGGGYYSTPIVSAFANAQRREPPTIETGAAVYELLQRFSSPFHKIWLVGGYDFAADGRFIPRADTTRAEYLEIQSRFLPDFCKEGPPRWSVVFVDHALGYLRGPAIEHFAESADFIVTHDTELVDAYGFEPCLSTFRYRWDSSLHVPHATIVSNFSPCNCFASLLGQGSPA